MEYAKDEIFSIRYNETKDELEYSLFRRLYKRIKNNKFITLLITIGALFSILNFTLIYYFIEMLNTI